MACWKYRRYTALVRNSLEIYWPHVDGLSAVNAIGTQLRDPKNSGLIGWRMAVINEWMDAVAELGRNPVSKHQIQPEHGDEQADAGRDCRTRPARPYSQARTRTGKYWFSCSADHVQDWQPYPVGPHSCYMCDHTYICGSPMLSTCPLYTNSGCGKERRHSFGTTLRLTDPVPADSRQWTPSVRNCVTR